MSRTNQVSRMYTGTFLSVSILVVICGSSFTRDNTAFARNVGIGSQCYWCPDGYAAHQSVFQSENGTTYGGILEGLSQLALRAPLNPAANVPLPSPGDTTFADSFFDVFVHLSPIAPGDIHDLETVNYRLTNANPPGAVDPDPIEIEIIELELEGQIGGQTVMIRESPTLASMGLHSIESLPDGSFQVDSFFDIFTELSLDGGQTWHQSNGPMRVSFVGLPEPGTMIMALIGLAGLIATARRFRRNE